MQRVGEFTPIQVAERLGVHPETAKRWIWEKKLKARKNREGKLYIKEYDLRDFLLERKDKAETFLQLFTPFQEFETKVIGPVEEFFGDEPGCVMALPSGGIPYALALYFSLPAHKDINFVSLSEKQVYEPALIRGRRILIVDDTTYTGQSSETVKEKLKQIEGLDIRDIKIAAYDDFAGCADFAVTRRPYGEHLTALAQALTQFQP